MQVFLVGGAVRDELLGRPIVERDWVVVGATPEELERQGYRAVGREFPVFLHPRTHEEYALARRERKTGPGYRGFSTQFSPEVTLEQDLQRRDLTINAIARRADGQLIDPFGGQLDLQQRVLRHVSPAFIEDPVRILRVARFAARFAPLGFTVAPETLQLMRRMVENGEVHALVPERVWRELERALAEPSPEACFDTLQDCGALAALLPELRWNAQQRRILQAAVALSEEARVRWAALLPENSPETIEALAERLRLPTPYRELPLLARRLGPILARTAELTAAELLALLEAADAFRRPQRFHELLLVAQAADPRLASARLGAALAAAAGTSLPAEELTALRGPQIAAALRAARERRLQQLLDAGR